MGDIWERLIHADLEDKGCRLAFDDVKILVYYINKIEAELANLRNPINYYQYASKCVKDENEMLKDQIKNYYEPQLRGDK